MAVVAGSTGPADFAVVERPLPALAQSVAKAARAAAPDAAEVRAKAWGDPASGCFSVGITLKMKGKPGDPGALTKAIIGLPGAKVEALKTPTESDGYDGRFRFERAPFRGWIAARGRVDTAGFLQLSVGSCFYNQRAPKRCETLCNKQTAKVGPT